MIVILSTVVVRKWQPFYFLKHFLACVRSRNFFETSKHGLKIFYYLLNYLLYQETFRFNFTIDHNSTECVPYRYRVYLLWDITIIDKDVFLWDLVHEGVTIISLVCFVDNHENHINFKQSFRIIHTRCISRKQ